VPLVTGAFASSVSPPVELSSVAPGSVRLASVAEKPGRHAANESNVAADESKNERLDIFWFTIFLTALPPIVVSGKHRFVTDPSHHVAEMSGERLHPAIL
jgi:hypothetical protein